MTDYRTRDERLDDAFANHGERLDRLEAAMRDLGKRLFEIERRIEDLEDEEERWRPRQA